MPASSKTLLGSTPAAREDPGPQEPKPAVTLLADGTQEAAHIAPKKGKPAFSRKRLAFKESSGYSGGSGR